MDINRLSLLKEYIKGNYAPVITDDKYVEFIPNHSSINSNNLDAELTIKSDDSNIAQEPKWLTKANQEKILVIRNIDLIEKDEQKKLIELLKYRKISTFSLNHNVIILLTCQNIDFSKIDNEIISLTIQTI